MAYSQRHPSTAADDLAIAALNLLALAVHACTGKAEAAVFAGLQTTVMVGVEAEACKLASIPDQLKVHWLTYSLLQTCCMNSSLCFAIVLCERLLHVFPHTVHVHAFPVLVTLSWMQHCCTCLPQINMQSYCYQLLIIQAIANSEAGQHSFELQDCARHMHGNLTQLTQRHHLSPAAATDPEASSANAQQTAHDDAKAGVAAVEAAGSKRAQAKARQVINAPHLLV